MFDIKLYNDDIDLNNFYAEAFKKKFYNNCSVWVILIEFPRSLGPRSKL